MTDAWTKKMLYTHTVDYYSALRKEENLVVCDNMDGPEDTALSETSQSQDKCCPSPLSRGV